MIIPAAALVLPIYLELNAVHRIFDIQMIGTSWSVILPFSFFPFGVYLAYIYYVTALPLGLLEAARVDGANELQTFLRIALPLAKPIVALVFFFSFVSDWNNFFLPYVLLTNRTRPDHRRPFGPARLDAVVQPVGRRRRAVGEHLQAGARARDGHRRGPGRDRLRLSRSGRSSGGSSAEG